MHTFRMNKIVFLLTRPFLFHTKNPCEFLRFMWSGMHSYLLSYDRNANIDPSQLFLDAARHYNPYIMKNTLTYYTMSPDIVMRCSLLSAHAGHAETLETFITSVTGYTLKTILARIDSRWYRDRCRKIVLRELERRGHSTNHREVGCGQTIFY